MKALALVLVVALSGCASAAPSGTWVQDATGGFCYSTLPPRCTNYTGPPPSVEWNVPSLDPMTPIYINDGIRAFGTIRR